MKDGIRRRIVDLFRHTATAVRMRLRDWTENGVDVGRRLRSP